MKMSCADLVLVLVGVRLWCIRFTSSTRMLLYSGISMPLRLGYFVIIRVTGRV
jgi:hypothetical protein